MDCPAASLMSFALPRVPDGVLAACAEQVGDDVLYGGAGQQTAVVQWLRAARQSGWVDDAALERALRDRKPRQALHRLGEVTLESLAARLNTIACRMSGSVRPPFDATLSLADSGSSLLVDFTDVQILNIDTLADCPLPVARAAYATLYLVARLLFPAMLPTDARCAWWFDGLVEDYQILVDNGVADDLSKAESYIEAHEDQFENLLYRGGQHSLDELLHIIRSLKDPVPHWMQTDPKQAMSRQIAVLRQRIGGWRRQHADWYDHPWSRYARQCLDHLHQHFPDERAVRNHRRRLETLVESVDGHAFVGQVLFLYSDTPAEMLAYDAEIMHMNESGETPALSVDVTALVAQQLGETLELLLGGMALLSLADTVNSQVTKKKRGKGGA